MHHIQEVFLALGSWHMWRASPRISGGISRGPVRAEGFGRVLRPAPYREVFVALTPKPAQNTAFSAALTGRRNEYLPVERLQAQDRPILNLKRGPDRRDENLPKRNATKTSRSAQGLLAGSGMRQRRNKLRSAGNAGSAATKTSRPGRIACAESTSHLPQAEQARRKPPDRPGGAIKTSRN